MLPARTEELTRLIDAVDRRLRSDDASVPNTVVLTGEAGIGKTTLLDSFASKLSERPEPPTIVRATCSTPVGGQDIGEVEALAPWLQIVAAIVGEKSQERFRGQTLAGKLALAWVRCIPVVGDVLESAADTALILKGKDRMRADKFNQNAPGVGNQEQMFRQCINLLRAVAETGPLVVIIDDVHWSDTSSTNLLFSAARELADAPVAFVPAYRPDEASISRAGAGHPIVEVVGELGRYGQVETIPLALLDEAGLGVLLKARYPEYSDQPDFEGWLRSVSGGNPLFITQYLSVLEEDGTVDRTTGAAAPGYRQVAVPATARAVIAERLRRLDDETRELLHYASVEGESFSTHLLGEIAEVPRLTMLRLLRRAESDHRIVTSLGKQSVYGVETTLFRFDHELIRRTLYESLGEEEREVVHEAMLEILLAESARLKAEGDVARELGPRIAAHASILGRHTLAAEASLEGAEACWREYSVNESLRLVEAAIDHVNATSNGTRFDTELATIESRARRTKGRILRYQGRYDEALPVVDAACEAAERSGEIRQIVGSLIDRAGSLRYLGKHKEAEDVVRDALERATEADFAQGRAGALNALGTILHARREHREAVGCFLEAIDLQREEGGAAEMAKSYSNLGNAFKALGDMAEATRCYRKSLEFAAESDSIISYGVALLHLGNVAPRDGDCSEAIEYYEQSREIGIRSGHRELERVSTANLVAICRESGRLDDATTWVDRLEQSGRRDPDPRFRAEIEVERGEIALARSLTDSRSSFDRHRESARTHFASACRLLDEAGSETDRAAVERRLRELEEEEAK